MRPDLWPALILAALVVIAGLLVNLTVKQLAAIAGVFVVSDVIVFADPQPPADAKLFAAFADVENAGMTGIRDLYLRSMCVALPTIIAPEQRFDPPTMLAARQKVRHLLCDNMPADLPARVRRGEDWIVAIDARYEDAYRIKHHVMSTRIIRADDQNRIRLGFYAPGNCVDGDCP